MLTNFKKLKSFMLIMLSFLFIISIGYTFFDSKMIVKSATNYNANDLKASVNYINDLVKQKKAVLFFKTKIDGKPYLVYRILGSYITAKNNASKEFMLNTIPKYKSNETWKPSNYSYYFVDPSTNSLITSTYLISTLEILINANQKFQLDTHIKKISGDPFNAMIKFIRTTRNIKQNSDFWGTWCEVCKSLTSNTIADIAKGKLTKPYQLTETVVKSIDNVAKSKMNVNTIIHGICMSIYNQCENHILNLQQIFNKYQKYGYINDINDARLYLEHSSYMNIYYATSRFDDEIGGYTDDYNWGTYFSDLLKSTKSSITSKSNIKIDLSNAKKNIPSFFKLLKNGKSIFDALKTLNMKSAINYVQQINSFALDTESKLYPGYLSSRTYKLVKSFESNSQVKNKSGISLPKKSQVTVTQAVVNTKQAEPILIYLQGEQVLIDTLPDIKNGVVYIPITKIIDKYNNITGWDNNIKLIYTSRSDNKLDDASYYKNGTEMVPMGFLSAKLKANVYFNANSNTLFINSSHSYPSIKTERLVRVSGLPSICELVDLCDTTFAKTNGKIVIKGMEKDGGFIIFTASLGIGINNMKAKFIFEDGYSEEQKFNVFPSDIYGWDGSRVVQQMNDFETSLDNSLSDHSNFWLDDKYLLISKFKTDNFGSHGKILRVDIYEEYGYQDKVSVKDINYNKKLDFINAIPVIAQQTLPLDGNDIKSLENLNFKLNNIKISNISFKKDVYFQIRNFTLIDSAVANFTLEPIKDSKFDYIFSIGSNNSCFGERDGYFRANLFDGINKDFTIELGAVPIIDTNKIILTITRNNENPFLPPPETTTFEFNIGPAE